MAQAFLVWRKNGILYKQCFGDCRGGALLHSPSFIAVSCLSTDDCFAVLLNRYKILYLTSSGLAPTGELRGCLVSPLRIRPRGEGSICGGRTLGVALPCHPSCLSRACSKTDRFLLRRYPGLRASPLAPPLPSAKPSQESVGGAHCAPVAFPNRFHVPRAASSLSFFPTVPCQRTSTEKASQHKIVPGGFPLIPSSSKQLQYIVKGHGNHQ